MGGNGRNVEKMLVCHGLVGLGDLRGSNTIGKLSVEDVRARNFISSCQNDRLSYF